VGIAIGVGMIAFSSIGIQNAKTRRGGKYGMQVIGLLLALAWTGYFLWHLAQAIGGDKVVAAQGARLMGRAGGPAATNIGTVAA